MTLPEKTRRALLSPWFALALVLFVLNDHVLKGSGILPGSVTGKLSDFAFAFFAPLVWAYILRPRSKVALALSFTPPLLAFAALNMSPAFSDWTQTHFSAYFFSIRLWSDLTDLMALAVAPFAYYFVLSRGEGSFFPVRRRPAELMLLILAASATLATSRHPRRSPTHQPVYMDWKTFRSAVKITGPRLIRKQGKILLQGDYLFVSEPNTGVHIIDKSDPLRPVQKRFIAIPGNFDIAIRGNLLYADSFVDLLVFRFHPKTGTVRLLRRNKDQFHYNPYANRPRTRRFFPTYADFRKGIVLKWIPLPPPRRKPRTIRGQTRTNPEEDDWDESISE